MKSDEVNAPDISASNKFVKNKTLQPASSNFDIAFLHSDALVINDKKQKLQPLKWEMTLSPEEMFEDMAMELL